MFLVPSDWTFELYAQASVFCLKAPYILSSGTLNLYSVTHSVILEWNETLIVLGLDSTKILCVVVYPAVQCIVPFLSLLFICDLT